MQLIKQNTQLTERMLIIIMIITQAPSHPTNRITIGLARQGDIRVY